ncbi:Homeobox protein CDX-2 [Grifola frondosa]|uniref:Homeobox protein CDX-2 n=1 Tax=Grifola frondosa TaxID=5627 RepID=A0A1C7M784_GRIFR|nr:Homeobox protein CDX-2 [Grifola frondosa]
MSRRVAAYELLTELEQKLSRTTRPSWLPHILMAGIYELYYFGEPQNSSPICTGIQIWKRKILHCCTSIICVRDDAMLGRKALKNSYWLVLLRTRAVPIWLPFLSGSNAIFAFPCLLLKHVDDVFDASGNPPNEASGSSPLLGLYSTRLAAGNICAGSSEVRLMRLVSFLKQPESTTLILSRSNMKLQRHRQDSQSQTPLTSSPPTPTSGNLRDTLQGLCNQAVTERTAILTPVSGIRFPALAVLGPFLSGSIQVYNCGSSYPLPMELVPRHYAPHHLAAQVAKHRDHINSGLRMNRTEEECMLPSSPKAATTSSSSSAISRSPSSRTAVRTPHCRLPADTAPYPDTPDVRQRRARSKTTDEQRAELERVFAMERNPTATKRKEICNLLGMKERQLQIWFQNRRAKEKHIKKKQPAEKSLPSAPPELHVGFDYNLHNLIHEDQAVTIVCCTDLSIGAWRRVATTGVGKYDLVAYLCETKRCISWFIRSEGIGFKMEVSFDIVVDTKFTNISPGVGLATFNLSRPPAFYREGVTPQGVRFWQQCSDWTEDMQATQVLRHDLVGAANQLSHILGSITPNGDGSEVVLHAPHHISPPPTAEPATASAEEDPDDSLMGFPGDYLGGRPFDDAPSHVSAGRGIGLTLCRPPSPPPPAVPLYPQMSTQTLPYLPSSFSVIDEGDPRQYLTPELDHYYHPSLSRQSSFYSERSARSLSPYEYSSESPSSSLLSIETPSPQVVQSPFLSSLYRMEGVFEPAFPGQGSDQVGEYPLLPVGIPAYMYDTACGRYLQ